MADSGAIRAGRAFVELFTDDVKLTAGLAKVQAKFGAWGKGISAMGKKAIASGMALAAPLLAASKIYAAMGAEMAEASAKTGVSVEALSNLKYAAEQSGVSMEGLETGLKKMSKALYSAAQGSPQATRSLRELGLKIEDLKSLKPDEQFVTIAEALSKVENPTKKSALSMQLFGKAGADLIPLMEGGAAGINTMVRRAQELGLTMSTEDATAAKEFSQRLDDLWNVAKMATFTIGGALAPVLRIAATGLTTGAIAARHFITEHKGLVTGVAVVAAGLIAGGVAAYAFGTALTVAGAAIGAVLTVIGAVGTVFAAIASPLGATVLLLGGATYALLKFTNVGAAAGSYLSGVFQGLQKDTTTALGGIQDALTSGDWGTAASIAWTYIKLEFQKGWHAVKVVWLEFTTSLLDTWNDFTGDVATGWSYMQEALSLGWNGAKTAASKFLAWLANSFKSVVNLVADLLQNAFMTTGKKQLTADLKNIDARQASGISNKQADIERNAAHGTFDSYDDKARSGRDKNKNSQYEAEQKARDAAYDARDDAIVSGAESARAKIKAQHEAERSRLATELKSELAKAENADQSVIDSLKRKLGDLSHRNAGDGPATPTRKKFDPDTALDAISTAKEKSSGTFNSSALFGLGAGNAVDKIAQNTKEGADATKSLAAFMKSLHRGDGSKVFT